MMKIFDTRPAILASALGVIMSFNITTGSAQEEEFLFDTAPEMDNWSTGPDVGETIPAIVGMDQHGNSVSFDDIKGPNGAYVVFHRSADW